MTSYYDVWKKKMLNNGNNDSEATLNHSKKMYANNFKNDPSYKKGILIKNDLSEIEVDTRVINIDKTTEEKRIQVLPDNILKEGDYIKYPNKVYIILEFESNLTVPYCKVKKCIQTINIQPWKDKNIKPMPCWGDNTSYGVKGKIDTTFFTTTDGKFQFKVQRNEYTDMLDKDIRIMFNHKYVYKIVEIENIKNENIYVITVDKDEILDKDDRENNIAYNECFRVDKPVNPNPPPTYTYNIIADSGDIVLKRYNKNTFRVVDSSGRDASGKWDITIEYNGIPENYITIKEKGNNYISLLNTKGYHNNKIIINFNKNTISLQVKVGLIN